MAHLKHHRNAVLELEGRKLKGSFDVSLVNVSDRQALTEMVTEIRKQLREFDPSKPRKKVKAKRKVPKEKVLAVRKGKKKRAVKKR